MELEERVSKIEERNAIVEADKAWETSWTRRTLVMLFTYLAMSVYLWAIGVGDPWLNGIVPTAAFMISSLTLPYFKREWLKHRND
jgi:hypothetical protein